jgi:alpha-tubulin suppressor-like RCC1 family protein
VHAEDRWTGRQGAPNLVVPSFCFDQNSGALLPERKCDPSRWVLADPQALLFNSDYLSPPSPAIVAAAAGAYHTVAITTDAKMLAWGWNGYGQLGSPTNMPTYGLPAHPADKTQRNLPTPTEFVEAAAQTAVFTQVGPRPLSLPSATRSMRGPCKWCVFGRRPETYVSRLSVPLSSHLPLRHLSTQVASGTFHSGAIDTDGYTYLWGANFEGQLCSGTTVNVNFPTRIVSMPTDESGAEIPGGRWVQMALGSEHSALLASTGQVRSFTSNFTSTPRALPAAARAAAASRLRPKPQVYACGSNRVKQLGRPRFRPDTGEGAQSSCLSTRTPEGCPTEYNLRWTKPALVLGSDFPLQRVIKIASGSFHIVALTADGEVFAWGDNRMNQLGQGPDVFRGSECCAVKVRCSPALAFVGVALFPVTVVSEGAPSSQVPFFIDNQRANEEHAQPREWPWPGYKVRRPAANPGLLRLAWGSDRCH